MIGTTKRVQISNGRQPRKQMHQSAPVVEDYGIYQPKMRAASIGRGTCLYRQLDDPTILIRL